jgi:hypothetical protein
MRRMRRSVCERSRQLPSRQDRFVNFTFPAFQEHQVRLEFLEFLDAGRSALRLAANGPPGADQRGKHPSGGLGIVNDQDSRIHEG